MAGCKECKKKPHGIKAVCRQQKRTSNEEGFYKCVVFVCGGIIRPRDFAFCAFFNGHCPEGSAVLR